MRRAPVSPFSALERVGFDDQRMRVIHKGVMEILRIGPYQSVDAIPRRIISRSLRVATKWKHVAALLPLCFHFAIPAETKRKYISSLLLLCCRLAATYKRPSTPVNIRTKMPTKPYQSKLIPFEEEIMKLRRKRPRVTYAHIAEMLCQNHSIVIQPPAICKFIKVRKGGRKVFGYMRNVSIEKHPSVVSSPLPAVSPSGSPPKPKFEFAYSERYNLHRLPPEEAAARRKKLEAEGH
jgi:hypothetical protein